MKKLYSAVMGLFMWIFSASICAQPMDDQDPYQGFNRHMYAFNDGIDKVIIKPIAKVYQTITPSFFRTGMTNVFKNIDTIPTIFNDILQADSEDLSKDTWRLIINSTVGVLGLWDVASHMNIPYHSEDFGLTLAKWGYKNSNYLVLPFFGPSTVRDTIGMPIDYGSSIYPYVDDTTRYSLKGLNIINTRSNYLNYDDVLKQTFDPYVAVRNGYLQRRNNAIALN